MDGQWRAHAQCARVVPETWVDEVEEPLPPNAIEIETVLSEPVEDPMQVDVEAKPRTRKVQYVFGVDAIVRDRWLLRCQLCTTPRNKAHGAPVQCAKGKCPRAFHVSCARRAAGLDKELWDVQQDEEPVASTSKLSAEGESGEEATGDRDVATSGVGYNLLGELEKEVIMVVGGDDGTSSSGHNVVSTIRKEHVEVFCAAHNDVAKADAKRRTDGARRARLVPGARVRVRCAAGVYEVTLAGVKDEDNSVEVFWDNLCLGSASRSSLAVWCGRRKLRRAKRSGMLYQHRPPTTR
ncbi:hypothetical protein BKA62DRAFT_199375 [Auriculariales sp. MPI-PUGE-AT-0066]|nr:hypothetical protein BKA62DRAFT_199375 [Auriculariales sp. MPI-PUGE-AT-0066]